MISSSQHFLKSNISETALLSDKVTIEIIIGPYPTYRMVTCLVTLTDLSTRRAGLSASAELLVISYILSQMSSQEILRSRWNLVKYTFLSFSVYVYRVRAERDTAYQFCPFVRPSVCHVVVLLCPRPPRRGHYAMMLSDICLSVWCLSVCRVHRA